MLLAAGPLAGFTGLIQILLWILVSFLFVAFVVTIILHYRRNKKIPETEALQKLVAATPESSGYKIDDREYVLFDHSGLIREYKTRLINNHARYTALKQDFDELNDKYHALLVGKNDSLHTLKKETMEQENLQAQDPAAAGPETLTPDYATEKNEWLNQAEELNRHCRRLEEENRDLLEKLTLASAGQEEKLRVADQQQEEIKTLKNRITEQEFIRDLVEEKNAQIGFLQQQLEQRIRNFHQSEQQLAEVSGQLQATRERLEEAGTLRQTMHQELMQLKDETGRLQQAVEEKEANIQEVKQELTLKLDHITYIENVFREIKEQNELLQANVADKEARCTELEQKLEEEFSKRAMMEEKLAANKQLLQRLYNEVTACLEEEKTSSSPVVALRTSYIHSSPGLEWDETAVH